MNAELEQLIKQFDRIEYLRCSYRQRPVSSEQIDRAEEVFIRRAKILVPEDLREFWMRIPTVEFNGGLIWGPVQLRGSTFTNGVVEEDQEWGTDGFVLFGNQDDVQHFMYNAEAGRWQCADFYDFDQANQSPSVIDASFTSFTDFAIYFLKDRISRFEDAYSNLTEEELDEKYRSADEFHSEVDVYADRSL